MGEQQPIQPIPQPITQEVPPVNIPPQPKKKSKIWLVLVFILLFLVAIGTAGYFAYQNDQLKKKPVEEVTPNPSVQAIQPPPTQDPTIGWKTYTDNTYNFLLKYPSSWFVTKGNEHVSSIPKGMTEIIKLQSSIGTIDINIIPWHNNLKKDLQEELSSFISSYFTPGEVSYEIVQLDGKEGLKGSYIQSGMGESQLKVILTVIDNGDYIFFFQTQFDVEDTSRFNLYNQILSTFKFIDQDEESINLDINTWKTFNHLKFSFKYPPNGKIHNNNQQEDLETSDVIVLDLSDMALWININPGPRGDRCLDLIKSENITIDNIQNSYSLARRDLNCDPTAEANSFIRMSFEKDTDRYLFDFTFPTKNEELAEQIFQQFISNLIFK